MSEPVLVQVHEVVFGILEPADDGITIISSDLGGYAGSGGSGDANVADIYNIVFQQMGA